MGLAVLNVHPLHADSAVEWRRGATLPRTNLGWAQITDHFKITVGPRSGEGEILHDLLVMADATLLPGARFALHGHRNVEIASIVLEGELLHREPSREVLVPAGSVQWMSAGEGIVHAETNASDRPVRMLQIWIRPEETDGPPWHQVTKLPPLDAMFTRISPITLRRGATVSMARLAPGEVTKLRVRKGRAVYLLIAEGSASINGLPCAEGDGAIAEPGIVRVEARDSIASGAPRTAVTVVAVDVDSP